MKLVELLNGRPVLESLAKQKLPAVTAYRIARNIKKVNTVLDAFDSTRKGIFDKYSEPGEDGVMAIPEAKKEDASREFQALLDEDEELDIIRLPIEAFPELTPMELLSIEWMIEEK
jgi:hypothetical protein